MPPPAPSPAPTDADALFRTRRIPEIRATEASTRRDIAGKEEELRQLVGRSYRDLLDSADSIILISKISSSVVDNIAAVSDSLSSLSPPLTPSQAPQAPASLPGSGLYSTAARIKYIIDTPEHIWGCIDAAMLYESVCRFLRAGFVFSLIEKNEDVVVKFPLVNHQWQVVSGFRAHLSQRARERLGEVGLASIDYADALGAVAVIDGLLPEESLRLFLDSRREWILKKVRDDNATDQVRVLCDVARVVRGTLGQVGELFLLAVNEIPLFYKTVFGSPPGAQLFGGVPDPDVEVRMWKQHLTNLESKIAYLEPEVVASTCTRWLESCCDDIFGKVSGVRRLVDAIVTGEGLGIAERRIRETLDERDGLDESLEQWLKTVFGSEIESPWNQIRGMILKDDKDVFEKRLEDALMQRMEEIIRAEFEKLNDAIDVKASIRAILATSGGNQMASTGGGVWLTEAKHNRGGILAHLKPVADENDFDSCLISYLGPEVSHIRSLLDDKCKGILEDLLSFVESNNAAPRLKKLAPCLQQKSYLTILSILKDLETELESLSAKLKSHESGVVQNASTIVESSLFVGRLSFALRYHSSHIPLIMGSPRQWIKESAGISSSNLASPLSRKSRVSFDSPSPLSSRRPMFDSPRSPGTGKTIIDNPRKQVIAAAAALFGSDDGANSRFDELNKSLMALCVKAHGLWIAWLSGELSLVLSKELDRDDTLSSSAPSRDWEVTVIKQEESTDGPLEISLPSMPSLYIISFLYQACLEIHKVGGHFLDKTILQNFAWELLQKVVSIYENFVLAPDSTSRISDKGVLQVLLDLRFIADVLSGGRDATVDPSEKNKQDVAQTSLIMSSLRRMRSNVPEDSTVIEPINKLLHKLSQRMDPIDWATYESHLWENAKQSYKRYLVLFGFFVQLNRMHSNVVQKLPTKSNTGSNIMRCSQVPRFKYLPISAPTLSSRGAHKPTLQPSDEFQSRSPWKSHPNGESSTSAGFDDSATFSSAAPLLKSFMTQVGSKFGESTSRWGSILSDGQVGIVSGSRLLSSLTAGTRFDS